MMRFILTTTCLLCLHILSGQGSPKRLIQEVNRKFATVKDYSAGLNMRFDIPSVRMEPVQGKVFYKQPDKFRIRAEGILFMPRQNPYFTLQSIRDTNAYTAILAGEELIAGVRAAVVNVIPYDANGELILARLWIDPSKKLILKSQLTTKSNGTIGVEYVYGSAQHFALPDKMTFSIDVARFKIPKAVAVDINSKTNVQKAPPKGTGTIELFFSAYKLNQQLSDEVFRADK
ncbi:MAG: LolA family protein [Saprospiraceae bacterium]|jgi:outer membrane lipoprotein-sorting protein